MLLCFAWARRGFFVGAERSSRSRKLLSLSGTLLGLVVILRLLLHGGNSDVSLSILGISTVIVSVLIFYWAMSSYGSVRPGIAFSPGVRGSINTSGPYKFVRHPFYLSYIIYWIGVVLIIPEFLIFCGVVFMISLYYYAARKEECLILKTNLSEAYTEYKKNTGMFLPF